MAPGYMSWGKKIQQILLEISHRLKWVGVIAVG